ncbi:MAG: hypothetical protein ABH822_01720 [Patescibacteria group bacterium]
MNKVFWLVLVLIIIFSVWAFFASRDGIVDVVENVAVEMEKLAAEDVYGGTAPEETLRMFAEALEAEDVELAAKYFLLEDDGTRGDWQDGLEQARSEGRLGEIVELIRRARPNVEDSTYLGDFKFIVLSEDGLVEYTIDMELNQQTGVWKIESL